MELSSYGDHNGQSWQTPSENRIRKESCVVRNLHGRSARNVVIRVRFNRFLRVAFYTFYLNCHQRSKDRIVSQVNEAMDDQYRKKAVNVIK